MDQAMKTLLIMPLLLLAMHTQGQLWCPEGAVWNYNFSVWWDIGCQTRTYLGETVVAGFDAQDIRIETITHDYNSGITDTSYRHTYTRVQDSVVYVLNNGLTSWDTLYWFSAQVGDRWYRPGSTEWCEGYYGMVEVVSIEEQLFGNVPLRVFGLGILDVDGTYDYPLFEMTERLGTPMMIMPNEFCQLGELWPRSRTYSDNTGAYYDSGTASFCDSFNAISESAGSAQFSVFPNPGNDQLQISFSNGVTANTLLVHDVHGRLVAQHAVQRFQLTLDTSSWSSGQYILSVVGGPGQYSSTKWTKQ